MTTKTKGSKKAKADATAAATVAAPSTPEAAAPAAEIVESSPIAPAVNGPVAVPTRHPRHFNLRGLLGVVVRVLVGRIIDAFDGPDEEREGHTAQATSAYEATVSTVLEAGPEVLEVLAEQSALKIHREKLVAAARVLRQVRSELDAEAAAG